MAQRRIGHFPGQTTRSAPTLQKEKQPDSAEEKQMTAISLCSIGDLTSTFELAMLSGARKQFDLPLPIHLPMNKDFHSLTQEKNKRLFAPISSKRDRAIFLHPSKWRRGAW